MNANYAKLSSELFIGKNTLTANTIITWRALPVLIHVPAPSSLTACCSHQAHHPCNVRDNFAFNALPCTLVAAELGPCIGCVEVVLRV